MRGDLMPPLDDAISRYVAEYVELALTDAQAANA
jgi:hypothetical protein